MAELATTHELWVISTRHLQSTERTVNVSILLNIIKATIILGPNKNVSTSLNHGTAASRAKKKMHRKQTGKRTGGKIIIAPILP